EDGVRFYATEAGLPIVIKPRPGSGLVSISLCARGGRALETVEVAGVTGLVARASIKGTKRRTAAELANAIEALGGSITPYAGADLIEWRASLPSRFFEPGLDLLLEAALEPTFPAAELERERDVALSEIADIRDDMYR